MNLVILLLALTVATGLSWAVSDLVDRWSRRAAGRPPLPRRHQPW
ncbi:MAG: hypothetical protein ACTHJH_01090 [Marmoricola sp.]